jgi:DNA-binding winged helix-turn-helix (wHTH) protein
MKMITIGGLVRKIQKQIVEIQKLDPKKMDPKLFKLYTEKARVLSYLCATAGQLIEKHELEKRLDEVEEELDKLKENSEENSFEKIA